MRLSNEFTKGTKGTKGTKRIAKNVMVIVVSLLSLSNLKNPTLSNGNETYPQSSHNKTIPKPKLNDVKEKHGNNLTTIGAQSGDTGDDKIILETEVVLSLKNESRHDDEKAEIWIQNRFPRHDRLGSNIQRPLYLMSYAHCYGHNFCIQKGRLRLEAYFPGFANQTCPEGLDKRLEWSNNETQLFDAPPLTKEGIYAFNRNDKLLENWFKKHKDCAFDDKMRKKWGTMIVDAASSDNPRANKTLVVTQDLFENTKDPRVVTVAINVRRGDFLDWQRGVILDQFYVYLLRHLRSILEKAGKIPEVHMFSEDYGMIDRKRKISRNWTMYEGLVQHYHLAPDMRKEKNPHNMDMALNLRDWRHFVQADILVVGGTFSRIPALGRQRVPDPVTGLPLTIQLASPRVPANDAVYEFGWSGDIPNRYSLRNLPDVFAKHDTVPVETFMTDLLADWKQKYTNTSRDRRRRRF